MNKVLDFRPGKVSRFLESDGQYKIHTQTDVSGSVRLADGMRQLGMGRTKMGDRLLASFEPEVLDAWCNRNGLNFDDAMTNPEVMKRFLNDPDNAAFRIHQGKV